MSPDRTAPPSLRPAFAPRSAAPAPPADGFAALLGAADKAAAGREPSASERGLERRRAGEVPGRDHSRHPARGRDAAGRSAEHPAPREMAAASAAPPLEPPAAVAPAPAPAPAVTPPAPETPATIAPVPASGAPSATDAAPAPAVAPPVAPVAPADSAAVPAAPAAAAAATAALPAQPQGPAPTAPAPAAPVDAAPPATGTPSPIAAPAPAEPPAPAANAAAPATAEPTTAAAPPAPPIAAAPTTAPAAEPVAEQGLAAPAPTGQDAGRQGSAPREQASEHAHAPAAASASAAPSAPAAAPMAPGAPATPLAQRSAPLHLAPRAVAQTLHVAVERGISHARLNLRPAELGGIEIRLQTSAAGVTAQVVADSPEAARLLQQAADELRRSLERHDVTLLSLDVSTAGDDRFDGSSGASADPAEERARHFAAHGLRRKAAEADEPPAVVATVALPDGVHIDVLA